MMRVALVLLVALTSGCMMNHSRKTSEPVAVKMAPQGTFEDDFVVQVFATS